MKNIYLCTQKRVWKKTIKLYNGPHSSSNGTFFIFLSCLHVSEDSTKDQTAICLRADFGKEQINSIFSLHFAEVKSKNKDRQTEINIEPFFLHKQSQTDFLKLSHRQSKLKYLRHWEQE